MPDKDSTQGPDLDSTMSIPIIPQTIATATELIRAAGKDPNAKEAGAELGKAARTIAKTINVALLPLAAINYAYDRARSYFEDRFEPDLQQKLADVPRDDIVEPKPSLAGPVMQGLAFSHDEDALREMYLHLLASAMNKKTAGSAHPAFVEIIKQLSAEEATMLCGALAPPNPKEIVEIRLNRTNPTGRYGILRTHLMDTRDSDTRAPVESPKLPVMIDNWIRLGLIDVNYETRMHDLPGVASNLYTWAEERPEFKQLKAEQLAKLEAADTPQQKALFSGTVDIQRGVFKITAFGTEFYHVLKMERILADMVTGTGKTEPSSAG